MSIREEQLAISLTPDQLELVAGTDTNIELKLDREDLQPGGALFETRVTELLDDNDLESDNIASVHLPPGFKNTGGMTAEKGNVGRIIDFSHEQMTGLSNQFMVTHPPKDFNYSDQIYLLSDLSSLSKHDISIENTSAESNWYTPEEIGFFGYASSIKGELSNIFLTIDSAHLPQEDYIHRNFSVNGDNFYTPKGKLGKIIEESGAPLSAIFEIDYDAAEELNDRFREEDLQVPAHFLSYLGHNVDENVERYFGDVNGLITNSELDGDEYLPLLRTLYMTGERVKNVHLNDPVENDVPASEKYDSNLALSKSMDYMADNDINVVLEPEDKDIDSSEVYDMLDTVPTR
ncbi:MAG: hypothetical protein ABEJ99_02965 [Candidatus Nanohaloarchaea archaeon]